MNLFKFIKYMSKTKKRDTMIKYKINYKLEDKYCANFAELINHPYGNFEMVLVQNLFMIESENFMFCCFISVINTTSNYPIVISINYDYTGFESDEFKQIHNLYE